MIAPAVAPLAGAGIIVLKSSLVLAVGWGITRALRGAPAASRHLMWLLAIVGALLVPVVDRLAPIGVMVLPAVSDSRASASPALAEVADITSGAARDTQGPVAMLAPNGAPGASTRWPGVTQLAGAVWAIVAFVLLARFALGIVVVKRLVRRSRAITSGDWTRVLVEAAGRVSVAPTPRLIMSDEVETAFTFGALAPAIVLPTNAQEWPDARRRAVLLHELAHIRRHDLVSHVIGALACALGWFHPFMWMAAGELRIESELASDEIVLGAGVRPSEYAQHLLDLVTSLRRRAPGAAMAIARPNELEGRLVAILDLGHRRAVLTRRAIGAWAVSLSLAAMCIGAVVPVPRTRPAPVKRPEVGGDSVHTAVRLPEKAQAKGGAAKRRAPATRSGTPSGDSAGGIPTRVVRSPIRPPGPMSTDSLFETLFSGISLTHDQATRAHTLLLGLQTAQKTQTTNTMNRRQEVVPLLQPHLDSVLLALPTTATDVDTLRSRLAQTPPGDGLYSRLFDGIALSSDQEAAARTAILQFQQDVRALMPPPEPPILGIRRNPTRVVMRPQSDSAFMALVSSDADRATLQSRISVAIPRSRSPN